MERIVCTKEELKKAIERRADTIVVGNHKLAKKITRFHKVRFEEAQSENIVVETAGQASVALPGVVPGAAPGIHWVPSVAAFAIMLLGGLAFYALTKNYDVLVEDIDGINCDEDEPRLNGGIKFVLKKPILR